MTLPQGGLPPAHAAYPLKRGDFRCPACPDPIFKAEGASVFLDDPKGASPEWGVVCPACGETAREAWYTAGARLALGKQTGPKTAEGKAAAAAARAAASTGPKTEEGKRKSSANAYKTGYSARLHYLSPPAKPGQYAECDRCPVRVECEEDVEAAQGTSRFVVCTTALNIVERFLHAAKNGNPERLREFQGVVAANAQRIILGGLEKILADGLTSKRTTRYGKDTVVEEEVTHPLLKAVTEMMKQQGYDLASWLMTPASQEAPDVPGGLPPGTQVELLQAAMVRLGELPEIIAAAKKRSSKLLGQPPEGQAGACPQQAAEAASPPQAERSRLHEHLSGISKGPP